MGSSTRRIARLTLDNLDDLPSACRGCAFWELDPVHRQRAAASGEIACEKEAWVSRVLLEWGSCGRLLYVDDEPAGYALYAPPVFVPGADAFPTSPVSEDAVLLAALVVRPEYAGGGLGRVLVQAVVKDVLKRGGIRAIEAFGDRHPPADGSPGCVIPADFLLRVGFKTHRRHARYPRLRMDMRSVLSWREEVEQALEKLLDVVRPRPVASPSPAERGAAKPAD
ncbi:MAG TPA: GNAT family N-acetyltransferase [Nocardioidaceae bacterium]|nr:GNAT family N-acetyltransferase [Nocardioidaceae bacterium]